MDKQPRKGLFDFEDMRPLAVGVPSVAIGICIVFISALLAVGPRDFDPLLRQSLAAFAIALPLFVVALLLLFFKVPVLQPYSIVMSACGLVWGGIFWALQHLDSAASAGFVDATIAAVVIILLNMAYTAVRRQRAAKMTSRGQGTP